MFLITNIYNILSVFSGTEFYIDISTYLPYLTVSSKNKITYLMNRHFLF